MNEPINGLQLTVEAGVEVQPGASEEARLMIVALLEEVGAVSGAYVFRISGPYFPFESLTTKHLEVALGNRERAVLVMLRLQDGTGGSVVGSLHLPIGADRALLRRDMAVAAENYNRKDGWVKVLQNTPFNPPPERAQVVLETVAPTPARPVAIWRPTLSGRQGALPIPSTPRVPRWKEAPLPKGPLVASSQPLPFSSRSPTVREPAQAIPIPEVLRPTTASPRQAPLAAPLGWKPAAKAEPAALPKPPEPPDSKIAAHPVFPATNGRTHPLKPSATTPVNGGDRLVAVEREQCGYRVRTKFASPGSAPAQPFGGFTPEQLRRFHGAMDRALGKHPKK